MPKWKIGKIDHESEQEEKKTVSFEVQLQFGDNLHAFVGQSGQAKISVGARSLWTRLNDLIRDSFQF